VLGTLQPKAFRFLNLVYILYHEILAVVNKVIICEITDDVLQLLFHALLCMFVTIEHARSTLQTVEMADKESKRIGINTY